MARVLATLGYDVVLLERGAHPRFAIGESSTPLANLSLERLARRYGLADCYQLSTHGRWLRHHPELRRGLKRGFTFYRHHPGEQPDDPRLSAERLLVAASPDDTIADTHWLRADVDHHFVREAVAAGADYRDRTEVTSATIDDDGAWLAGRRGGESFELHADFVIDASGPGGFLADALAIPSGLEETQTRSAIVFGHFTNVRLMNDVAPRLPAGPYPDDQAAVHHVIDEGWMYSLRFDHGVTSAGFLLRRHPYASHQGRPERSEGSLGAEETPAALWRALLDRYPTIAAAFADAQPVMPVTYRARIQHRLTRAAGSRWVLMPHAYAFVDPLFSTGIAWGLRAVERLALCFEENRHRDRRPSAEQLARYAGLLSAEADQADRMVAGAYEAMAHFDLLTAHAMLYFATVSFAEVGQRLLADALANDDRHPAWSGFLGVGDDVLEPLARESLRRLRRITNGNGAIGTAAERREYVDWVRDAISARNIGGFGDPARANLYPVDLDVLLEQHALLGMTRDQLVAALPKLRGMVEASF